MLRLATCQNNRFAIVIDLFMSPHSADAWPVERKRAHDCEYLWWNLVDRLKGAIAAAPIDGPNRRYHVVVPRPESFGLTVGSIIKAFADFTDAEARTV